MIMSKQMQDSDPELDSKQELSEKRLGTVATGAHVLQAPLITMIRRMTYMPDTNTADAQSLMYLKRHRKMSGQKGPGRPLRKS